ncbi:MAG: Exo-poly-alpha-D-galacturonosidase [Bacteroidetes bacterium]|nr:Exo-poly-alpha-D-galacturonosidase [Bacteroidota bacterium]
MNVPRQNLTEQEWLSIKDFLRPVMVSFIECKNVYLQGVLFENSPSVIRRMAMDLIWSPAAIQSLSTVSSMSEMMEFVLNPVKISRAVCADGLRKM